MAEEKRIKRVEDLVIREDMILMLIVAPKTKIILQGKNPDTNFDYGIAVVVGKSIKDVEKGDIIYSIPPNAPVTQFAFHEKDYLLIQRHHCTLIIKPDNFEIKE